MKWLLVRLLVLTVLVAVGGGLLAVDGYRQLNAPLVLPEAQNVEIANGSRFRDAVAQLKSQHVFSAPRQAVYLEAWARLTGSANLIKAGQYRLEPGVTSLGALALLVGGKAVMHELRIVEGMSFDQAMKLVQGHPEIRATLADTRAETIMAAIGHPGLHPEGRFFPDTYRFPKGTTDVAVLRTAFDAMDKALADAWSQRAAALPYAAPEGALIMASIVEKETGLESERSRIAGVFVRRLQAGMRLQTDPTVIYGLGLLFDGNLRKRDLLADGPYNTYLRTGLPPTPICLPGRAALLAAVQPAPGTELFFVARRDGSHQFSTTLAEHEAAVKRYQLGLGG